MTRSAPTLYVVLEDAGHENAIPRDWNGHVGRVADLPEGVDSHLRWDGYGACAAATGEVTTLTTGLEAVVFRARRCQ